MASRAAADPKPLTPKQAMFVREYLVDLNATQAAIRAGYSAKRADAIAHENLRKPVIAKAIAAAMKARADAVEISAEDVLRMLADEARADLADLYDDSGNLRPIRDWPLAWRRGLVVGIESFEEFDGVGEDRKLVGMTRKVKLSDRIKHKELIGRHLGMFIDRSEVKFPDGAPQVQVYLPDNKR